MEVARETHRSNAQPIHHHYLGIDPDGNIYYESAGAGLAAGETVWPDIKSLSQVGFEFEVTENDICRLQPLPKVEQLTIFSEQLTNQSAKHLASICPELAWIKVKLFHREFDARPLQQFPKLETVTLENARLSDENIADLSRLPNLTQLFINGSESDAASMQRLKNGLPKCRIVWDGKEQ